MLSRLFAFLGLVSFWAAMALAQENVVHHPLDALTPAEIAKSVAILKKAKVATDGTLFPTIALLEPAKDFVKSWKAGKPIPRSAFVIMRDIGKTREARINLATDKFEVVDKPGAQPTILNAEWERAQQAVVNDPRFIEAMKKRGYKTASEVLCTPNSAGFFPAEGFAGRRMLKVPCYDNNKQLHPTISRPIEGVMGIVDSETGEVVNIIDTGVVPLPDKGLGIKKNKALKPIGYALPLGPNARIKGNTEVEWLNWSFHLRADKRAGLIVSRVTFDKREIAYQMNVSEMFVPYMDPDPTWEYRTFMDAGEFGLGSLISPLEPDIDCPAHAAFLDMIMPADTGQPYAAPSMVCIFERITGDPAWRHHSAALHKVDGVQQMELVVRHIPTVGNYDYVIDYVFSPQGNITLRVGATGFDALKAVRSKDMSADTAAQDTAYGALVAPFTVAPNHDHYINFRLDLDIDGTENTLLADKFVAVPAPEKSLRKSLWKLETSPITSEGAASDPHMSQSFRIANLNKTNSLGQQPSYRIDIGHQATSILSNEDPPQQRAQFSANSVWLTRQKPDELWAAGTYANVSERDTGLPDFAADHEPVENQDVVIWTTMGFRHATRPEDMPILPTYWHEMTLRPAFFFDKDPSSSFNPGVIEEEQQ